MPKQSFLDKYLIEFTTRDAVKLFLIGYGAATVITTTARVSSARYLRRVNRKEVENENPESGNTSQIFIPDRRPGDPGYVGPS